jgi:serine/threonine-protein kinase HipA
VVEDRSLDVLLEGTPIGRLRSSRRTREIVYEPIAARPFLSIGDRSGEPWDPRFTRAWFEGLLPEGPIRERVAARFDVDPSDAFSLLEAIGWECAGAVAVVPRGHEAADHDYRELTDTEVGERLDALPGHPADEDAELRVSLGGQQDKLVLARLGGRWCASLWGAPTTHILKPEPPQWPGLVEAEAWSLTLASHVTAAASAEVAQALGSRPVLIVTRFDRIPGDIVVRLHQEDGCQALGLLPGRKYAEHRGRPDDPSYWRIAELLRANATDVVEALGTLLLQMVVRVALMDADGHAKNVSLLHDGGGYVRLAPLYDLAPTTAFLRAQRHLAIPVAGRHRMDQVEAGDLVAEAVSWGYPRPRAVADVAAALATLDESVAAADAIHPGLDPRARLAVTGQIFRLRRSR